MPISDPMRRMFVALAALLLLAATAPRPARADKASECLHGWSGPALTPGQTRIACVDDDPACDMDPTAGVCRIEVGVCLNQSDATGRCAPRELDGYQVENAQPDTDPRHVFEFQALQDQVNATALPLDPGEQDACVGPVTMFLPLEVKIRKQRASYRKSKQTLRAGVWGPEAARDDDALALRCLPAAGSDPCAQVGSTLQHLEQHVFAPTCSRDTCHTGPQSDHTLSLLPGEAFLNLVGVQPDNLVARLAGKLRVDAGDPDNSFILDKLRGDLEPDMGERMPRGLPRIPAREIALVEAWIRAGAPETGFVEGIGCQAP